MPRKATASAHGAKIRASITMDPSLYVWITARTGAGKEFASLSHAIERAVALMKDAKK